MHKEDSNIYIRFKDGKYFMIKIQARSRNNNWCIHEKIEADNSDRVFIHDHSKIYIERIFTLSKLFNPRGMNLLKLDRDSYSFNKY